jgi:TRAP-type C4-dicarboxylate transport system substrate-binding protein
MNAFRFLRRWLLVVGLLLWPAVSQAAEVTVKMGISVGGDHLYVQMSKLMAKEIEKRYPAGSTGNFSPAPSLGGMTLS